MTIAGPDKALVEEWYVIGLKAQRAEVAARYPASWQYEADEYRVEPEWKGGSRDHGGGPVKSLDVLLEEWDDDDPETLDYESPYDRLDQATTRSREGVDVEIDDRDPVAFAATVADIAGLTKTERRVAEWIAGGGSVSGVDYAERMRDALGFKTTSTARVHLKNTKDKLGSSWAGEPADHVYRLASAFEGNRAPRSGDVSGCPFVSERNRVLLRESRRAMAEHAANPDSFIGVWDQGSLYAVDYKHEAALSRYYAGRKRPGVRLSARTELAWYVTLS